MSVEAGKSSGATAVGVEPAPPYYYGTFQGVANHHHPPPHSVASFPHPTAPPSNPGYYSHGYQAVPGYAVVEEIPLRERRLRCCGLGIGWLLFITGFFLGAIPWYIGAFILLCVRVDYREKPGLVACLIAAILAVIAVTLGVTKATHSW